jgi:hypothetical protein
VDVESAAGALISPDVLVDALVADGRLLLQLESPRDLLGAMISKNFYLHRLPLIGGKRSRL